MKNEDNKKVRYSKKLVVFTSALFLGTLIFCLTRDYTSFVDVSIYASALTITGGIMGTSVLWYMKKTQAEHITSTQSDMYENVMRMRLEYNKEMMKLKKQYKTEDFEIEQIEMESPMDDFSESVMSNMEANISQHMHEATSSIEMENY